MVLVRRKENLRKLLLISEVLLMRISPLVFFKIGFCLLLQSGTSVAHHAFSAEFDQTKPVMLRGTVTRMEWINPHSWLHIDVRQEDGTVESWMIEAGPAGLSVEDGQESRWQLVQMSWLRVIKLEMVQIARMDEMSRYRMDNVYLQAREVWVPHPRTEGN